MSLRIFFSGALALLLGSVCYGVVQANQDKSIWDGVFTAEQAKRGEEAYKTNCSECHGGDLLGDGFAPSLTGAEFQGNWNDLSVGDLFERIRISMPPSGPSSVPPAAKADILAHIFNMNKYPAGTTELEPKTEALKTIKIELKKP
jgi:mono/diheme cytochrome c family protein